MNIHNSGIYVKLYKDMPSSIIHQFRRDLDPWPRFQESGERQVGREAPVLASQRPQREKDAPL